MTKSIGYTLQIQNRAKAALKKNICLVIAISIITIVAVMEAIEYHHYGQFIEPRDGFLVHWNWIFFVPVAVLWIWAEMKEKYVMPFIAGGLFCLADAGLIGGTMLREHGFFSWLEAEALFLGEVISVLLFVLVYVPVKIGKFCENRTTQD